MAAMTAADLRMLLMASGLSQADFADAIGMGLRKLERLLAGRETIGPALAGRIMALWGADEDPSPYYPRDRWVVGEGPPPERREYVIHTAAPRFIARVVAVDDLSGQPEPREQPADITSGVVYGAGDSLLCEVQWIDPVLADPVALTRLLDMAADQLEWDL